MDMEGDICWNCFFCSEYLFEPASKVWTRFVEGELRITDKIQQQIMHVGSVCKRQRKEMLFFLLSY